MSSDPQRNPLVGAKLLRSALNGSHDLSISESANPLSLKMWEKSGGATLPPLSLSWMRILKPVTLPFAMLSERLPFISAVTPLTNGSIGWHGGSERVRHDCFRRTTRRRYDVGVDDSRPRFRTCAPDTKSGRFGTRRS